MNVRISTYARRLMELVTQEDLIDVCSALFHLVDHTPFYYNINVVTNHPALLLKL